MARAAWRGEGVREVRAQITEHGEVLRDMAKARHDGRATVCVLAELAAARTALSDVAWRPGLTDGDLRPELWDAECCAALIVSGSRPSGAGDEERRRAFWAWWLKRVARQAQRV